LSVCSQMGTARQPRPATLAPDVISASDCRSASKRAMTWLVTAASEQRGWIRRLVAHLTPTQAVFCTHFLQTTLAVAPGVGRAAKLEVEEN
jgi:hypothetical protein